MFHYLISSRIAGYEEAGFSENVFTHYRLLEFDDHDIGLFIRQWYAIVESDNLSKAEQDAEDLEQVMDTKVTHVFFY